MLNSAAGVMLPPSDQPPPIAMMRFMREAMRGSFTSASPILVRGPKQHKVTVPAGWLINVSMMKSGANCFCNGILGSGRIGPSKPVLPCTCSAVIKLRSIGREAPAKTFISGLPASSQILRAFTSVKCSGTLPATAVMPSTSISGEARANKMASASSWPGSVSMMIECLCTFFVPAFGRNCAQMMCECKRNAVAKCGLGQFVVHIQNDRTFAFKFEFLCIMGFELVNQTTLAMKIHGHNIRIITFSAYAKGAATFLSQKAELVPAQGLGNLANFW